MVRQQVAVATRPRRRLEERVALRFPRVMAFLDRLLWRLSPRSRLRQAVLRRLVQVGLEALNRGDFEAAFARSDPKIENSYPIRGSWDSASTACIAVTRSAFASNSAGSQSGATSGLPLKS